MAETGPMVENLKDRHEVTCCYAGWEGCLPQDHRARLGAGDPIQGEVTMTRRCLNCEDRNGMKRFAGETFAVEYAGRKVKVEELSGWRCGACDEVEFDAESARRYAEAGDRNV